MLTVRRGLPLAFASALAALACAAGTANAADTAPVYSAPSGAWSQFTSELNSASGIATGRGVTVAIVSDGVDSSASGLRGKVTEGPSYFGKQSAPPAQADGTSAASLIVGVPGVLQGAAPDVKILDMRVIPSDSVARRLFGKDGSHFDAVDGPIMAKAVRYAAGHGASVIEIDDDLDDNDPDIPPALVTAVRDAVAKGVVIVVQGWNDGNSSDYLYPQGFPGVIGVASVMLPGGIDVENQPGAAKITNTSANNNSIVIAGPGDWVPNESGGWGSYGPGTAVPYVTATAALIKQRYPLLAPALVERALAMSARDKPSGGYSTQVGFGVIDPYDAVLDAATLTHVATSAAPGPGVAAAGTHFGTGPLPGPVYALPSALWQIILSGAGIVVGAALLAVAALTRRKRRKTSKATEPGDTPEAAPA